MRTVFTILFAVTAIALVVLAFVFRNQLREAQKTASA